MPATRWGRKWRGRGRAPFEAGASAPAPHGLNRLLTATVAANIATPKTFSYDPIGNMLSKSDVGTYSYPAPGSARPHAVSSISGSTISTTFTYDANGNQVTGLGRSFTWTSYNKPASITQGSTTVSFYDDTDHQRFKQVGPQDTTFYLAAFGMQVELHGHTGVAQWRDYLSIGSVLVGLRVNDLNANTITTRYFHTDHLGSIAVITDESGAVVERQSFDAWGKRRFANGADDPAGSIVSQTTRGFTGHEQLPEVGLVHMNGRVYDPLTGRMTSADPTIPDPLNAQAWNRYSYVGNDPLAFTDPNGYSWLSNFFRGVGNFFRNLFERVPILRSIVQYAATTLLMAVGVPAPIAAAAGAMFVTGLSGGKLGDALKAGASAAVSAMTGGLGILPSAAVGCVQAMASGGKCGAGAASAAISSVASALTSGADFVPGLIINTALGGLASVAGGGKFANGAATAAFSYVASQLGRSERSSDLQEGDGVGGDGAPDYRFMRDANGELVYSNEIKWNRICWCEVRESDGYRVPRDNNTTFHGGVDWAPIHGEGGAPGEVFSLTDGVVEQVGAKGFGPYSVTIKTPGGNYVTYGHLAFNMVKVKDTVFAGEGIGIVGSLGNSSGPHVHGQITAVAPFGDSSRFLGIRGVQVSR